MEEDVIFERYPALTVVGSLGAAAFLVAVALAFQNHDAKGNPVGTAAQFYYNYQSLSHNPGLVNLTSAAGLFPEPGKTPLPIPNYPTQLSNVTIKVEVWAVNGNTNAIRFRTNAAGEQGRVSYVDLPCDLNQVGDRQCRRQELCETSGAAESEGARHSYAFHSGGPPHAGVLGWGANEENVLERPCDLVNAGQWGIAASDCVPCGPAGKIRFTAHFTFLSPS
jgi:hypothetical protein